MAGATHRLAARAASAVLLLAALPACLGAAADPAACSAAADPTCSRRDEVLEAVSEEELELAEEAEAALMRLELLQRGQRTQHAAAAAARASSEHAQVSRSAADDAAQTERRSGAGAAQRVNSVGDAVSDSAASSSNASGGTEGLTHARSASAVELKTWGETGASDISARTSGARLDPIPKDASKHREPAVAAAAAAAATAVGASAPIVKGTREASMMGRRSVIILLLAAVVAYAIKCTGLLAPRRKYPAWTLPPKDSDSAIRAHIREMEVTSAADLEELMSQPGSSSDGPFKPSTSAEPVRLEVRIEGFLDRSTMQSPLAQRSCVMYSAAAVLCGERTPIAFSTKRRDFIVSMSSAPWVKILVESADVLCFGIWSGLWQHRRGALDECPDHLMEFVISHMKAREQSEESEPIQSTAIEFEESALVVGSMVTLVGKLCPGPGGQLSLQNWHQDTDEIKPGDALKNDSGKPGDALKHESGWAGKVLATDDPHF